MAAYFIKANKGENLLRESVSKREVITLSNYHKNDIPSPLPYSVD